MFKKNFLIVLVFIIFLSIFLISVNSNKKTYKVLYIASYHPSFSWSTDIERGVINSFRDKNIKIKFSSFYMDTKRHSSPEEKEAAGKKARELILKTNPDIIILSDENALIYTALRMHDTEYKFVFCGINGTPEMYNLPTKNITGVLERLHYEDAVIILKQIDSKVKKVTVISEDSESSALVLDELKSNLNKLPVKVTGIYQTNSFEDWKKIIKNAQSKSDALLIVLYFSLKDSSGNYVDEKQVIKWLVSNSNIPEVGLWPFLAEDGGFLAVAVNGYFQGYISGNIAINILRGKNPMDIKIKPTTDGTVYINLNRAKQLHLIIPTDILQGSKILPQESQY